MSKPDSEPESYGALALPASQSFLRMLEDLATSIPPSEELWSANPGQRAREIVRGTGLKAGVMSTGLALPPGPMGMLTVIPDLLIVLEVVKSWIGPAMGNPRTIHHPGKGDFMIAGDRIKLKSRLLSAPGCNPRAQAGAGSSGGGLRTHSAASSTLSM